MPFVQTLLLLSGIFFSFVPPSQAAVRLETDPNRNFILQADKIRVVIDARGDVTALDRLQDGQSVWSLRLPAHTFWNVAVEEPVDLSTCELLSIQGWQDSMGAEVETVYLHPKTHLRIKVNYRVSTPESDRLRTRYVIDNLSDTVRNFRIYFATIGNLPTGPDKWLAYPYRSGQLMRSDSVQHYERPSPGHMWMQWMGYYDGANGLLSYAEDVTGYLKFANHWPRNGLTLSWSDAVYLAPQERYAIPYDYVIRPLATPDGFHDLCSAYGQWGRKQAWMASCREKMKRRPALKQMTEEGIVKVVGIGALPVPANEFIPREEKEQMVSVGQSYDRILELARHLEQMYDVKPVYRHDGWWGRFDSAYPFVLPVSEKMGGDEKFRWYLDENRKEGRIVVLHNNPVQCDTEMAGYDAREMACDPDGNIYTAYWSGNRLSMVSPRFAIPTNLEILRQLRQWGTAGVFWDVIGAMAPVSDFNPNANYSYFMKDSHYQDLLRLFAALRDTAPAMIFGTEDGQEPMLPYFDYAPSYGGEGDGKTLLWAPLNELVYGDAFVNAVGIEGNINPYNDSAGVVARLYGATLGGDARTEWPETYTPVMQQIFEVNRVLSCIAAERMQRHWIDPTGWRASIWPNAVVIGNVQAGKTIDVAFDTSLGTILVKGMRPNGFAIVTNIGHWIVWGVQELSQADKRLVRCSNPDSVVVCNAHGLTLASYGFFDPRTEKERQMNLSAWEFECSEWANRMQKQLVKRPDQKPVKIKVLEKNLFQFTAPGPDCTYFIANTTEEES